MGTTITTGTPAMATETALYHLLSWLSPAYPIGAFSHSNGLEWAVEAGWVTDRPSLTEWLDDLLAAGAGWNDAVLFAGAHRAVAAGDAGGLGRAAELAAAAQPSRERRLETVAQGAAFRRIASASASVPALALLDDIPDEALAYPIAAATLVAGHDIGLVAGLTGYLHGFVSNLVSAGQRLIPLGHTDGQLVLAALRPAVAAAVARAEKLPPDDLFAAMGSATLAADLASLLHETQYTRLFRT